ncbi:hypothetical protein ACVWXL_005045 [Bradyrhizobium sp. GM22.5]
MNRPERTFTTDQIRLERRLPSYWRVTFDMPPVNIFGPKQLPLLDDVVTAIETDPEVKVVVFDSAVEGFFITHYDFLAPLEDSLRIPPGPTGLQALPDMLVRLSRAPVVSRLPRSGAARPASAASWRSRATCALPAAKRRSCRNGKSVRAWCPAAGRWRGCRA